MLIKLGCKIQAVSDSSPVLTGPLTGLASASDATLIRGRRGSGCEHIKGSEQTDLEVTLSSWPFLPQLPSHVLSFKNSNKSPHSISLAAQVPSLLLTSCWVIFTISTWTVGEGGAELLPDFGSPSQAESP